MIVTFETFIDSLTTAENASLLKDAYQLLTDIGYVTHQEDIERIIVTSDNHESVENLSDTIEVLLEYSRNGVAEFGVTLGDQAGLKECYGILKGLFTIENYGDPEYIYHILNQEDSNETTLSDLLDLTSPLSWYTIETHIEYVTPMLIEKIKEVLSPRPDDDTVPKTVDPRKRERFLRLARDQELMAWQALREGKPFNTPLEGLLVEYEQALLEVRSNPQQMAEELVALVALSDTPVDQEIETHKVLLEDFYEDVNAISVVFRCITQQLTESH